MLTSSASPVAGKQGQHHQGYQLVREPRKREGVVFAAILVVCGGFFSRLVVSLSRKEEGRKEKKILLFDWGWLVLMRVNILSLKRNTQIQIQSPLDQAAVQTASRAYLSHFHSDWQ